MKRYTKKTKEQGVALLLALGILTLLLVMALAFATNSIIARKVAQNNASRTEAMMLARSVLNRIQGTISEMAFAPSDGAADLQKISGMNVPEVYPTLSIHSESNTASPDEPHTLRGNDSGNKLFLEDENGTKLNPLTNKVNDQEAQWNYIRESYPNGKIIGRYAYVIMPSGKIDLSHYQQDGGGTAPSERYGKNLADFSLADITTLCPNLPASLKALPGSSNDKPWLNWDHLFYLSTISTASEKAALRSAFDIFTMKTPEAYFYHPNAGDANFKFKHIKNAADGYAGFYHRFNLLRPQADWENLGGKDANSDDLVKVLLGESPAASYDAAGNRFFATQTSNQVHGIATGKLNGSFASDTIQFLRMIGEDAGAYPNLTTRRKQIAADLIDYCDSDRKPTSDISATNDGWKSAEPTYTGNEHTPYINEVALGFSSFFEVEKKAAEAGAKTEYTLTGNISVSGIAAELIDYYQKNTEMLGLSVLAKGTTSAVTITGTVTIGDSGTPVSFTMQTTPGANINLEMDIQSSKKYHFTYSTTAANACRFSIPPVSYIAAEAFVDDDLISATALPNLVPTITINKITLGALHLSSSSNGIGTSLDYVRSLTKDSIGFSQQFTVPTGMEFKGYGFATFEVDDPRNNLYQANGSNANWNFRISGYDSEPAPRMGLGSIGEENTGVTYAALGDKEMPSKESLKNHSQGIKSIDEIGRINRGAKWETINLLPYDPEFSHPSKYTPTFSLETRGSTYAQGDAGILDQLKLTDQVYSFGKIDLNLRNGNGDGAEPADQSLLKRYQLLVKPLLSSNGKAVAQRLNNYNNPKYISRSALLGYADTTSAFGEWIKTAKADKEQFICRIINLTEALDWATTFNVLIVVQTIKDAGDNNPITVVMPNHNSDPVTGTIQQGSFDVQISDGKPVYFDQITGEVKLYATILRDPITGQLHVVDTRYIDGEKL